MEVFERSIEEQVRILQGLLANNRMTRFRTEFLALHNYDQAQIFNQLKSEDREKVYQYLSPSELANIFDALEAQDEKIDGYFEEMLYPYAANVLAEMYADNAVDVLNELKDRDRVNIYMHLMPAESAREISQLINYLEDTAGAIMTTEYIAIEEGLTLAEAYYQLRQQAIEAETIYYVYVIDQHHRLTGVISLRDLIINDEDKLVADVMNNRVISVQVNDDQLEVAKMVKDYDLLALPVVGFDQELLGIVTVDDVLDVMQEEAESDYSGLAAVDVSEKHISPWSAAKSRLPWLITLLFLGMGTSTVISRYSGLVEEVSILSAFITLITGTAGNAGTQSLAVTVRQLNSKDHDKQVGKTFGFELLTGAITGLVVALCVFLIVFIWKGNPFFGLIIAAAMFMAIVVANLAGLFIPYLMDKLGFDPAVASGPFISTLSDLTSVFIYFTIAGLFLAYLL
ncbi:magnesium transporter [Ignavigranum ruoffiae]|uniref:magnesium transporter n=1 Tax=Ignavigranum ruoffiae TaxID=89093 RepID=UPI002352E278|nr:magnesium transporter [Ignavigranum ruoffiae]